MTSVFLGIAVLFAAAIAVFLVMRRGKSAAPRPRAVEPVPPPYHPAVAPLRTPEPEPAPDPDALARARAFLAPHRRTAYLPVVEDGDGGPGASSFCGAPLLAPGEAWPPCGHCGKPMQLFVQLAADELPAEARERIGAGNVMQLFYCTSADPPCEFECDAYAPHAASTLVRIVPAHPQAASVPIPAGMFPPKRIVGWTEADDFPGWEDRHDLGVEMGEMDAATEDDLEPRTGDKLLGWPLWIQSLEYPDCRICGARMELLFQVDSEDHVPYLLGDLGTGHVTQCPAHPAELAFGWACT